MREIELEKIPNQQFSLVIGQITYRLRIIDLDGTQMVADVNMDGTDVVLGIRCIHADFLLPWPSLEAANGNFMFIDDQQRAPYWRNFGSTARLFYVPPEEMVL